MTVETPPPMPAPSGNVSVDVVNRHEHFAAMTAFFERNPPNGQVATPAAPVPAPNPTERVREFDSEMRATGLQRTDGPLEGEPDQRGLDYLINLKRTTPEAEQTHDWKQTWERDYASIVEGRRFGESPAAFAARKADATPAAPLAGEPEMVPVPPAELSTAVESLSKASDTEGRANHTAFPAALLSGYVLPPGSYDSLATVTELKAARAAGISQAQVNAVIAARMKGSG